MSIIAQKLKLPVKNFFSKCKLIHEKRICSYLLIESLTGETFSEFRFLSPAESPVENLDSSYLDSVSPANLKHTKAIYTFYLP